MISWNVYVEDINSGRIVTYNVFNHGGFLDDCQKNCMINKEDKESFISQLRLDLAYRYKSKCEWEVVVISLFPRKEQSAIKIDVYQQVRLNWEQFCDYVWTNKDEFRKEKHEKKRGLPSYI